MSYSEALKEALTGKIDFEHVQSVETISKDLLGRLKSGAIISYSQNFEDVILRRIFHGQPRGFYVDVGAFDPYLKSTTCLLHQYGWSGINIDLCSENIQKFTMHRPRDVNICAAIGKQERDETYYVLPGTTRSTKVRDLGESYKQRGMCPTIETIRTTTLTSILKEHEVNQIDLLSIDVEGVEYDVIQGLDFSKVRPKIIVGEATYPETSKPNSVCWENILKTEGYECIYFDGLNKFFALRPCKQVRDAVNSPPNYFDNFIRYEQIIAHVASMRDV